MAESKRTPAVDGGSSLLADGVGEGKDLREAQDIGDEQDDEYGERDPENIAAGREALDPGRKLGRFVIAHRGDARFDLCRGDAERLKLGAHLFALEPARDLRATGIGPQHAGVD